MMRYSLTDEKVEMEVFAKTPIRFRVIGWIVVLLIVLAMAMTMKESALILYLFCLVPIYALVCAFLQSRQKAVFDLVHKKATVPRFLSMKTFEGKEIDRFQKVIAAGKSDYYVMLLKADKHGQGYRIMPRYGGMFGNRNQNVEEFEAKILPVISKIIE